MGLRDALTGLKAKLHKDTGPPALPANQLTLLLHTGNQQSTLPSPSQPTLYTNSEALDGVTTNPKTMSQTKKALSTLPMVIIHAIINHNNPDSINKFTSARLSSHQTLLQSRSCLSVRIIAPEYPEESGLRSGCYPPIRSNGPMTVK